MQSFGRVLADFSLYSYASFMFAHHLLSALALLQLSPNGVDAAPIETCADQLPCLDISVTQNTATCTGDEQCTFTACIALDTDSDGCIKAGDGISHLCDRSANDDPFCPVGDGDVWDGDDDKIEGVTTYTQCQTGVQNEILQFAYKDGSGGGNPNQRRKLNNGSNKPDDKGCSLPGGDLTAAFATTDGYGVVDCAPTTEATCTGGGNIGKECLWTVKLPANCDSICPGAFDIAASCVDNVATVTISPDFGVMTAVPTGGDVVVNTGLLGGTDYNFFVAGCDPEIISFWLPSTCETGCDTDDDCPDWLGYCCEDEKVCKPVIGACEDPHMTGFRGQKFDFAGQDGEWYALVKSGKTTHLNMRITAPVPEFPHISYITGISLMAKDADGVAHSIVISAKNPHATSSSCPAGVYPCLADGSLSVMLDGQEALVVPGSVTLGNGVVVSAVTIPGECRSGGFGKFWEAEHQELARHGRRVDVVQSMADWVLGDPTAKHKEQCAKYVADAEGTDGGMFAHHSEHASFQIVTPAITLPLNHGWIAYEGWRDPTDTFNYPDHETWQMNLGLEHNELITTSSGVLGETFVPTLDEWGQAIMWGKEAIRGSEDDYHVDGPYGKDFAMAEFTS